MDVRRWSMKMEALPVIFLNTKPIALRRFRNFFGYHFPLSS